MEQVTKQAQKVAVKGIRRHILFIANKFDYITLGLPLPDVN